MITPLKIRNNLTTTLLFSTLLTTVNAQNSVEKYIEQGVKNNIVLQQKSISLEKALYSLKTANSLFFPSIAFKADYQSGDGGRSISIPTGDLLNPVYSTLNQLTQSDVFPQIDNAETNFFPKNFYDAKIRTTMPILNSDLIYNRQIEKHQVSLQQYDVEIYKNELIKNIKVAYYNYLSAVQAVSIYESALILATRAKHVNESLLSNGRSVRAYVIRSESEIQNLKAKKEESVQQARNAQLYFNFLLNADGVQNIDTANNNDIDTNRIVQCIFSEPAVADRTELKALDRAEKINATILRMNKSWWYPQLSSYLDLGSQESDWKYTSKSRYYLVGVQLNLPLFAAGKNNYKINQSKLDLQNQKLISSYTTKQIQLTANFAKNNLSVAYENYKAALKLLESATTYNSLIESGYREGTNTFIETIDARNQLTASSLQVIVNKYQLLGAIAIYEREISK